MPHPLYLLVIGHCRGLSTNL